MLRQDMESIYATLTVIHNIDRQHREEMMAYAQEQRLVHAIRTDERRAHRSLMAWAGRRLVASGHYLLRQSEPDADLSLATAE